MRTPRFRICCPDNRLNRMDLTATKKVLEYRPKDDAFRSFDIPIR